MNDLISRQAAIDALVKRSGLAWEILKILQPMLCVLEELPPAEPEVRTQMSSADCISRQAALDTLNGIKITRNANWYEFYQKALAAVGKLPPAQQWIPCEERLPEPGVNVLVDVLDIPADDRFPLVDKIGDDGEWLNCDCSEWLALAWMTIPEPWKGERDG